MRGLATHDLAGQPSGIRNRRQKKSVAASATAVTYHGRKEKCQIGAGRRRFLATVKATPPYGLSFASSIGRSSNELEPRPPKSLISEENHLVQTRLDKTAYYQERNLMCTPRKR